MKYLKHFTILSLIVASLGLFQMPCFAETKEIITEGTYIMGDNDTPADAENRALTNAKRSAIEQAGTYIESYSQTQNLQLTKDDIETIASGDLQTTIMDKKRIPVSDGNMSFWVKIKCIVNTDSLAMLQSKLKDSKVQSQSQVDTYNPTWGYLFENDIISSKYRTPATVYIDTSSIKVIGRQNPVIKCWTRTDIGAINIIELKNIDVNSLIEQVLEERFYTGNRLTQAKKYEDAAWTTPVHGSNLERMNSNIVTWVITNHLLD